MRFGAIPFHLWAARLTDVVPETALPILTAFAPASLAVVALAWIDASVAPLLVDLGPRARDRPRHRDRVDRAGRDRRLRPGRPRARPWLLDRRRRRRRRARARGARARGAGRRRGPGSSPSSWPAAPSPRGRRASGPASGPGGSPTCAAGLGAPRSSPSRSCWWSSPASGSRVWPPSRPGRRSSTWRSTTPLADHRPARDARRRSPTTGGCWSIGLARPDRVVRAGGRVAAARFTPLDVTATQRWLRDDLGREPGVHDGDDRGRCSGSSRSRPRPGRSAGRWPPPPGCRPSLGWRRCVIVPRRARVRRRPRPPPRVGAAP